MSSSFSTVVMTCKASISAVPSRSLVCLRSQPRSSSSCTWQPHVSQGSASGYLPRYPADTLYRAFGISSSHQKKQQQPQLPPRPTLPDSEIHHTYLKGSGPGGQKINKTSSAAQLTHLPTGIVVKCQATRSRAQNHKIAKKLLAEKVELLQKGDESRMSKVQERKSRKKKSAEKKRRRKYRRLEEEREGGPGGEEDEDQEVDEDEEEGEQVRQEQVVAVGAQAKPVVGASIATETEKQSKDGGNG